MSTIICTGGAITTKCVIGALLVLLAFVKIFVIISASIAGGDADEQMERMMEEWRNEQKG